MELVSYAIDFVSFLVQNFKQIEKVKSIILFGSSARGESTTESDVDIFIDVAKEDAKMQKEAEIIKGRFFDSVKYKKYWVLHNIKNDINLVVGKLNRWKLRDSMLGSAIVLYQKYAPKLENGKSRAILSWDNVRPESARVMINKKLFGYNYYGKRYSGAIEKYSGRKLGSNVIIIDNENISLFLKIFHNYKVPVKINRIFEYEQ